MFLILPMMILAMMMLMMKHPLSCGLILLVQTILTSMITGMLHYNFWYSYIFFLIMVGGMLILFLYMTSIASNEKFKFTNKLMIMNLALIIIFTLIFFMDKFYFSTLNQIFDMKMELMNNNVSMKKYFNLPHNLIMLMMIIYLFLTLIAIVKITKFSYGSLRQKF
uniref:NADH-ubiquinone oxidoreductase chain 6 n=1 Tax=Neocrepidodera brevicollis TaxID=1425586 RepID=A0A3G1GQJ8_9CUCU|nr:NADH dehydrogenase subunit 6 [Neocrepidodera brevicollis]